MAQKVSNIFSCISFLLLVLLLSPFSIAKGKETKDESAPSPIDFLKHLEGCHKGEKVQGLHKLKQYLHKFGYLNYHDKSKVVDSQQNDKDNDFDDLLESAIKTYQLNYHLKPTGTLDVHTASKMMMPRCGVPDVINGISRMRAAGNQTHHNSRSGSFHTVSHYAFFTNSPKWPVDKYHLTFAFLPGTRSDATGPVAQAFSQWAAATQFTFEQVQDSSAADIKISFESGNHGDGTSDFNVGGRTLAHAFPPTDGRFHYNADETWSVGPVQGAYDLESVALHEIGHLLGLDHSSVPDAIMWSIIPIGETKGLHGDDIQGIKALYNIV